MESATVVLQAGGDVGMVLVYVAGAIVYGLASYFAKRTKPEGEPFDPRKLLRTVIIGIIVGVVAAQEGIALDPGNFWQIATAIGAPAIAERIVQIIYRLLKRIGVIPEVVAEALYPSTGN